MKTIVSSYHRTTGAHYECQDLNPAIGHKIKIEQSVKEHYRRKGAHYTIIRDNYSRHVVSALIPVIGLPDVYYGDYHGDTIGVFYNPEFALIRVVLFTAHNPKYLRTRSRRVKQFIKTQRTTAI
jgi:hypothetical protein